MDAPLMQQLTDRPPHGTTNLCGRQPAPLPGSVVADMIGPKRTRAEERQRRWIETLLDAGLPGSIPDFKISAKDNRGRAVPRRRVNREIVRFLKEAPLNVAWQDGQEVRKHSERVRSLLLTWLSMTTFWKMTYPGKQTPKVNP